MGISITQLQIKTPMKKAILFLGLIICANISADILVKSNNIHSIGSSNSDKEVELIGDLPSKGARSAATQPIILFQETFYLQADFNRSLGCIYIFIYDNLGNLRYQESIDTSTDSQLYIDTSVLSTGNYTIKFASSESQSLIGNFDL